MAEEQKKIDNLCINTIRTLSMDAIQKANSGHPGAPMGLAPAAYVLWTKHLRHNPANSSWPNRDRFVLSGGHASMLLYSLLYLTNYGLSLDDIKNFRQIGSKTPGHPEYGHTNGVEVTTGPLGQGIANAVGMAMAERHLAARFNKEGHEIIDHNTYVVCGDGDLMEGISHEAVSLAGHLGLSKLICLYDDNQISIEGKTDITFTEDVEKRFQACNWKTIKVSDGNNPDEIDSAINEAKQSTDKPVLILMRTNIAFGSPNKQDSSDAHGAPLGEEEIKLTKKNLNWPEDSAFEVPEEAKNIFGKAVDKGKDFEGDWQNKFKAYTEKFPELANELVDGISGFLTYEWEKDLPVFKHEDAPIATRAASGKVLNSIAKNLPALIGGSADLAPSNKTYLDFSPEFQKGSYEGRNIRFGVREHAMGAIMAGMFLHGGTRPYGGTFLVFADYMRPAIRVASLMKLPIIYVFTHDSIAVGEDGPTHQPVEHLASLRSIPGLNVIRPGDASETVDAWKTALITNDSPTAIILSRQKLPVSDRSLSEGSLSAGAYIIKNTEEKPDLLLIASGSELHLAIEASEKLSGQGIKARVISMPSWELFEKTQSNYKEWTIDPSITKRVVIEAGISMGWEKYAGNEGMIISMEGFGESGPGNAVLEKNGFSTDSIVEKVIKYMKK